PHPSPRARKAGLPSDIDNIVAMAMRVEPQRRYVSAAALAEDVQRHLASFPVRARPDTVGYRASRFIRRNRAVVLAASLTTVAVVGGAAVAVWEAYRARAEQARAQQRFDDARR